ncbi:alpha/beta hydrolase [Hymenobacter sp. BT664]|uniref:Alpha/beta hydrolase n=1 Tax=Hymenobacter montanus TaxID=2771359 RepID=A0A927GIR3_9BACT|nr:alpha/beta hydrolase [Hymenobacter montanus]MBD2767620.1 alpha/beta hydrolase [Hymenobacter montanus]
MFIRFRSYLSLLFLWLGPLLSGAVPPDFERFQIDSRLPGLRLSVLHLPPARARQTVPVLFVHGASFPSALSAGFRLGGTSWMDDLAAVGYDTYALDFLGYGHSDRYPQMAQAATQDPSFSTGRQVAQDLDRAVEAILRRTRARQVYLVGHSWGATVCAYYASQHPERISRLVLFAPFPPTQSTVKEEEAPVPPPAYQDMTPAERVAQFRAGVPAGEAQVLALELASTWPVAWLQSDPTAATRRSPTVRFPSGWEVDLLGCGAGQCYYDPSRIAVPTLLMRGEWDQLPSAEAADAMFRRLTRAPVKRYVVIGRATHVAHLEKSRFELYQEVRSFLAEPLRLPAP